MTERYFVYDANVGFDTFDTEDAAIQAAQETIDTYRNDGEWSDEIDSVVVGIITHRAARTNVVTPDMLNDGEYNGIYYSGNCDYWCDYEMLPVGDTGEPSHIEQLRSFIRDCPCECHDEYNQRRPRPCERCRLLGEGSDE